MPTEPWDEPSERLRDLETAEFAPDIISSYLALPGLRGFWPMSSVGVAGEAIDLQGLGNHLARQGDPEFNFTGLVPYCDYDGTGDYHDITDAASANAFDILGNEAYIKPIVRGLTLGTWVQPKSLGTSQGIMCKGATVVATSSYEMLFIAAGGFRFRVSNGAAFTTVNSPAGMAINQWWHVVGRYAPGVLVDLFVNGVLYSSPGAAPAAPINNSAFDFTLANFSFGGINELIGYLSLSWICAEALSNGIIRSLFQQTRSAFGV